MGLYPYQIRGAHMLTEKMKVKLWKSKETPKHRSTGSCLRQNSRQLLQRGHQRSEKAPINTINRFPPSVMLWAGITASGKTPLIFVEENDKISAKYYQNKILLKTTEARNMIPVQRAPSRLSNISNPPYLMPGTGLPLTYGGPETPLPYSTAPVTPLYNTPHATPMPPGGPQTGYGGYGMQPNQMMMCVPSMPNYGMQMQPMYMPQLPTNPAPSQNGGINLVVNTNANASGNATGCKGAANERMCPKCRKGSIIRAQQRKGEMSSNDTQTFGEPSDLMVSVIFSCYVLYTAAILLGIPCNVFVLFRMGRLSKKCSDMYSNGVGLCLFVMAIADIGSLCSILIHYVLSIHTEEHLIIHYIGPGTLNIVCKLSNAQVMLSVVCVAFVSNLWLLIAVVNDDSVPYYLQFGFNGVYLALFIYDKSTRPIKRKVVESTSLEPHQAERNGRDLHELLAVEPTHSMCDSGIEDEPVCRL
uniref:G_PROTEIN_RECEP_F1_2 domain-containing protein n=1 Tax=Heterorhabditis bacteriophora TaxID=37862 RepID=A0A1I7XUB2_HETBA